MLGIELVRGRVTREPLGKTVAQRSTRSASGGALS